MKTTTRTKKIVVKFRGSNLKAREDFAKLFQVINLYQECQQPIVIVISAFYGAIDILKNTLKIVRTDEHAISDLKQKLIGIHNPIVDIYIKNSEYRRRVIDHLNEQVEVLGKYMLRIRCLGETPDFMEDRVLSYGERLSSLVLTSILNFLDIPCIECLPEAMGLLTNEESHNASVNFLLAEEAVQNYLSGDNIYVVPDFYGISPDSKVMMLGREGSDYTAAAIARCVNAASLDLWKDVSGFTCADPKLVKNPKYIEKLTYNEAAELSYFGACFIQPQDFEPVIEKKIPVRLFDINNYSSILQPMIVIQEKVSIKEEIIKSVTYYDDFGVLQLHGTGIGIKTGIIVQVVARLNDEGINIKSIITSQTCINILLSINDLEKGLQVVNDIGLSVVERIISLDNISLIAVVGEGILEEPGVAARVLGVVSSLHINIRTIVVASNITMYFFIAQKDREKFIQAIHKAIFDDVADNEFEKTHKDQNYPATLGYII